MYEVLLYANLLLWLGCCAHFVTRDFTSAFHPAAFYLFFHGLIFTLVPFLSWYRGYESMYQAYQFMPSMEDKQTVMIGAMLGLLSFYLVCISVATVPPRFPQDRFDELTRAQLRRPALIMIPLLLPFALASVLDNWNTQITQSTTMVMDAATGRSINTTGNGYFSDAQLMLGPLAMMIAWLFRFRWWSLLPFAGFVILKGGTGGRWPIILALGSLGLLFLYENRRRWPNLKALAIGLFAMALFQAIGADRGAGIRSAFSESAAIDASAIEHGADLRLFEAMDYANLQFYEYLVYAIPQRTGTYGYFLDNLELFTRPIPRVLWTGKPVGPPIQLWSLFDYGYPIGMTYSLPGEGWVQLGYLGVFIWCALFGWFFAWIYNRFQSSRHSHPAVMAYLFFLPLSLTFFRDGFLITLVVGSVVTLVPVFLVVQFAKWSRSPTAEELRLTALRIARRKATGISAAPIEQRAVTSHASGAAPAPLSRRERLQLERAREARRAFPRGRSR